MRASTNSPQLDRVLGELNGVRRLGGYSIACCPAHDDRHQSLSIKAGRDGRVLLKCHAGCKNEDVLLAAGLEWQDLFPNPRGKMRAWIMREVLFLLVSDPIHTEQSAEGDVWRGMVERVMVNIAEYGRGPTMFSQWWGEQEHDIPESRVRDGTDDLCKWGKIRVSRRVNTWRKGNKKLGINPLSTRVWDMLIEVPDKEVEVWLSDKIAMLKSLWRSQNPSNGRFSPACFNNLREGIPSYIGSNTPINLACFRAHARGDPVASWREVIEVDGEDVDRRDSGECAWRREHRPRTPPQHAVSDFFDLHEIVRRNLGARREG